MSLPSDFFWGESKLRSEGNTLKILIPEMIVIQIQNTVFFCPEYSRVLSKNCLKWIKCKFVRFLNGLPP